jgi:hypothetical protein
MEPFLCYPTTSNNLCKPYSATKTEKNSEPVKISALLLYFLLMLLPLLLSFLG